jgi:translocation and assembly module TamA
LKNGDAGRADFVIAGESRALGQVLNDGYADAALGQRRVIVDHADYSVHPIYRINTGERARLGEIMILGTTKTKTKWVKRIVPWQAGDTYSTEKISELQRRIIDTGAYDSVNIRLGDKVAGSNIRTINVTLEDRAKTTLETLVSYSTTEGVSGEVRVGRYNMFGRGDSFINRVLLGQIESRLETTLKLPHYRKPDQTLSLSLGAFRDDTDAYREQGIDAKADITRKFTRTSYWSVGVDANYAKNREPSYYLTNTNIDRNYWAFSVIGTYLLDKTDNILNPKRGFKADATIEPTLITGDANLSYIKMVGQASYYKGLDKTQKTVFASRARIGSIIGGSIPEIPAAKRLYVGGGGSVRGYKYQGIGPRYSDSDETPIGGLSLVEMSVEIRHQFDNKMGFVAFIDTGTLGIDSVPSFDEFKAGGGVGFRYDLGFAPLRIDLAVPFDKPKNDPSYQIYIGVGQSF